MAQDKQEPKQRLLNAGIEIPVAEREDRLRALRKGRRATI